MKWPRIEETIFFKRRLNYPAIVEVRSRPIWVIALELWFLYVHEFWTHILWERVPERLRDKVRDPYWGDPSEAAFHHFYYWSLNKGATIDKAAHYTNLREGRREIQA